jgi:hypothetical protein
MIFFLHIRMRGRMHCPPPRDGTATIINPLLAASDDKASLGIPRMPKCDRVDWTGKQNLHAIGEFNYLSNYNLCDFVIIN